MQEAGWRSVLVGDHERSRWHNLVSFLQESELAQHPLAVEFTRRSDNDSSDHGMLDHLFVSSRLQCEGLGTWEQAPGDH